MKIANIVYESELVNHVEVEFINYYRGDTVPSSIDFDLPTLYVGWSFIKNNITNSDTREKLSILETIIVPNKLYWEFAFSENKTSHIKGVNKFVNLAPRFYFESRYKYFVIDPVISNIYTTNEIIDHLVGDIDTMYNYKNEMLYLLSGETIMGIDLKMFEFFKFSPDEIILEISKRTKASLIDLEGISYQQYLRIFPNFSYLKRYLVIILSNNR